MPRQNGAHSVQQGIYNYIQERYRFYQALNSNKKSFQQEVHSNRPIMKRTFQRVCHSNGPPVPTTNQPTCKNYPAYCARCLVKGKGYYQYNWSRIPYLKPCIIEFNRCTAKLIETAELNRSNEKELRYRYL